MNIALVGAGIEENLGVGMIAAAAERAGHEVAVVPFNEAHGRGQVLARILSLQPRVVGLLEADPQYDLPQRDFTAAHAELRSLPEELEEPRASIGHELLERVSGGPGHVAA